MAACIRADRKRIFSYLGPILSAWTESKLMGISNGNSGAVIVFACLILFFALFAIHEFGKFRLAQLRWFSYPPLPIAVVIGLAIALLWPHFHRFGTPIMRVNARDCIACLLFFTFWLVQTTAVALVTTIKNSLGSRGSSKSPNCGTSRTLAALTDDELTQWIRRERPITTPSEDLFGLWEFSEGVVNKLESLGSTIVIRGALAREKRVLSIC